MIAGSLAASLALLLGVSSPALLVQDEGAFRYESLYPEDTLRYWAARYGPNLRYNFDTLIPGALTLRERRLTRGLRLNLALRGPDDPLTYFVTSDPPVVTVSVASVKFLDDLAIASAWLAERDYSIETIAYYADVLKYRAASELPHGRYPAPHQAVGIPANALQESCVDHASQLVLKSAIFFALAHEIGHVVGGHAASADVETRVAQEMEADRFATDLFRRIGVAPLGVAVFFLVSTHLTKHRGDFSDHRAWTAWVRDSATHPLSSRRLTAIAGEIRKAPAQFVASEPDPGRLVPDILGVADQLAGMAPLLEDTLIQRHAAIVGRRIPLSELRPRRAGNIWLPGE